MDPRIPGLALALGAACCYGGAVALQAGEARALSVEDSRPRSLVLKLAARRRWLAGLALGLVGWPLQEAALLLAPLALVQAGLAFGPLVLLALAPHQLQESVGRREVVAGALLVGGVAALAIAVPARSDHHEATLVVVPVLAAMGAVALLPYVLRGPSRRHGAMVAACAGVAYGASGLAAKLLADDLAAALWIAAAAWLVIVAGSAALALTSEMTSYRLAPASRVAPVAFALEIGVPIALAPLLTGDRFAQTGLAVAGGAALLAAVLVLAASPSWGRLAATKAGAG